MAAVDTMLREQLLERRQKLEAAVGAFEAKPELTRLLHEVDVALARLPPLLMRESDVSTIDSTGLPVGVCAWLCDFGGVPSAIQSAIRDGRHSLVLVSTVVKPLA